ncbi:hypothetical protein C4K41_27900, partial [Escherichia coli]|uniref:LEPR-XLL domain-containing protein n=1 Tax=Escherichia coli TaxID=562 RepID=UPI000D4308D7
RQLVLRLKAKADRLFNRDRLIFDPLEPRVLLNSDITYQIGQPSDPSTEIHEVLVKLINENTDKSESAAKVLKIHVYDKNAGEGSNPLHV